MRKGFLGAGRDLSSERGQRGHCRTRSPRGTGGEAAGAGGCSEVTGCEHRSTCSCPRCAHRTGAGGRCARACVCGGCLLPPARLSCPLGSVGDGSRATPSLPPCLLASAPVSRSAPALHRFRAWEAARRAGSPMTHLCAALLAKGTVSLLECWLCGGVHPLLPRPWLELQESFSGGRKPPTSPSVGNSLGSARMRPQVRA